MCQARNYAHGLPLPSDTQNTVAAVTSTDSVQFAVAGTASFVKCIRERLHAHNANEWPMQMVVCIGVCQTLPVPCRNRVNYSHVVTNGRRRFCLTHCNNYIVKHPMIYWPSRRRTYNCNA